VSQWDATLIVLQKQTNTLVHTAIILLSEPVLWKMDIVCKFEVAPKLEGLLRDASCALKPILTLCWLRFDLCLWCMFMVKVTKNLYVLCSCADRLVMIFNSLFLMLFVVVLCTCPGVLQECVHWLQVCYTDVITSLDTRRDSLISGLQTKPTHLTPPSHSVALTCRPDIMKNKKLQVQWHISELQNHKECGEWNI